MRYVSNTLAFSHIFRSLILVTGLTLAAKHSDAVDFPKTGVPVRWDGAKQKWPHFMEKRGRNSYTSTKALGKLYDRVCRHSFKMEFHTDWEVDFDPRILNRYDFTDEKLELARDIKIQYDTSVRRILSQHSLGTEFELWTGFALSKPAAGSDYKRSEDLGREYEVLKSRFRELCYEKSGGHSPDKIDPFVAAMYKVTEEQVKTALRENNERTATADKENEGVKGSHRLDSTSMPLITFPWIFHNVMIRIATGGKYNPNKTTLASARHHVQQPVYDPKAKGPDADAETTRTEAKPSEALNIAAQETAEPSMADDAAGVSGSGQPYDHPQDFGAVRDGKTLDMGLNDDTELVLEAGRKAEQINVSNGMHAPATNEPLGTAVKELQAPLHLCESDMITGTESVDTKAVEGGTHGDGAVANGLPVQAEAYAAQLSDDDSDYETDAAVKGNGDLMEDMMAKLVSWGQ